MAKIRECVRCEREINIDESKTAEWRQGEGWVCGYCVARDEEERHYRKTAKVEEAVYEETEYCLS